MVSMQNKHSPLRYLFSSILDHSPATNSMSTIPSPNWTEQSFGTQSAIQRTNECRHSLSVFGRETKGPEGPEIPDIHGRESGGIFPPVVYLWRRGGNYCCPVHIGSWKVGRRMGWPAQVGCWRYLEIYIFIGNLFNISRFGTFFLYSHNIVK